MELLAFDPVLTWSQYIWPLLQFIIGLSLVVFVHELGHFLVAKKVGIKVERFALGFGKRVIGFKMGDTDYCLCALPLGGYVKMLGQEDFKPLTENDKPDPRSYEAKTVGARMAVIAAGVVMNIILAAILFVIIGMVGKDFPAPYIGGVTPGMPMSNHEIEWQGPAVPVDEKFAANVPATASAPATGLSTTAPTAAMPADAWNTYAQGGDKVLFLRGPGVIPWLNDGKVEHISDVQMTAALSSPSDEFELTIERTVNGMNRVGVIRLGTKYMAEGLMGFGISFPLDTKVPKLEEMRWDISPLAVGDRIVEVQGQKVEHFWDIRRIEAKLAGLSSAKVTVERDGKPTVLDMPLKLSTDIGSIFKTDGSRLQGVIVDQNKDEVKVQDGKNTVTFKTDDIDKDLLNLLGMKPRIRVEAIYEGSSADKAGLKQGDVIVDYADKGPPTHSDLMKINLDRADQKTSIEVLRDGKRIKLWVTPRVKEDVGLLGFVPGADLAEPVVAKVEKTSPAAKANIKDGARIVSINGKAVKSWADVYHALSAAVTDKPAALEIVYREGSKDTAAKIPNFSKAQFDPQAYRFYIISPNMSRAMFSLLMVTTKQPDPLSALVWGGKETVKMTLSSYASLLSLIRGDASLKQAAGPIGMAAIGMKVAKRSFVDFVYLMAFISAAVAVFNFLPLPVVDGGHAVFLIIEKIRGKPVPVKVMNYVQVVGLVLLAALFIAITYNDISKIVSGFW